MRTSFAFIVSRISFPVIYMLMLFIMPVSTFAQEGARKPAAPGGISGFVYLKPADTLVKGATVTINTTPPRTTTTDANGNFFFSNLPVPDYGTKDYVVEVTAKPPDYNGTVQTVTAKCSQNVTVNLYVEKPTGIEILATLLGPDEKPVEGVTTNIFPSGDQLLSGPDGSVLFPGQPEGSSTLVTQAPGWQPYVYSFHTSMSSPHVIYLRPQTPGAGGRILRFTQEGTGTPLNDVAVNWNGRYLQPPDPNGFTAWPTGDPWPSNTITIKRKLRVYKLKNVKAINGPSSILNTALPWEPHGPGPVDLNLETPNPIFDGQQQIIQPHLTSTIQLINPVEKVSSCQEDEYLAAAEWFVGAEPGEGNGNPFEAVDGAFDEAEEEVDATIDMSTWPPGEYTIYIRGKWSDNSWGTPSFIRFYHFDYSLKPPTDLTVSDIPEDQGNSLLVSWSLSPDDASIENYHIFRSRLTELGPIVPLISINTLEELIAAELESTILIATVPRGTTSYTDPFVPVSGVAYSYWIQSVSGTGASKIVGGSKITSVVSKEPQVFTVSAPYPNPFNPSVAINYMLGMRTEVNAVVFDLLGRKVRTLCHGIIEPGSHTLHWDGIDAAGHEVGSGVYLYTLTAGNLLRKGKMLLMR